MSWSAPPEAVPARQHCHPPAPQNPPSVSTPQHSPGAQQAVLDEGDTRGSRPAPTPPPAEQAVGMCACVHTAGSAPGPGRAGVSPPAALFSAAAAPPQACPDSAGADPACPGSFLPLPQQRSPIRAGLPASTRGQPGAAGGLGPHTQRGGTSQRPRQPSCLKSPAGPAGRQAPCCC